MRRRLVNPSHPLPSSFPRTELGLKTRAEFLRDINPRDQHHDADSYDHSLADLNPHLVHVGGSGRWRDHEYDLFRGDAGYVIQRDGKPVAAILNRVMHVLHGVRQRDIPDWYGGKAVDLGVTSTKVVKYLDAPIAAVLDTAAHNRSQFPHVLHRLTLKGEAFVVRAEKAPKENHGVTTVILNANGEVVAKATDEWGATLIRVAREYRSQGLGPVLWRIWHDQNPTYESGGFTPSGKAISVRMWEDSVRTFLARGWYSALLAQGRITAARVQEILRGVSKGRGLSAPLPVPHRSTPTKRDVRVLIEDFGFVIYDARFLADPDEKYILAHGFFRSSDHVGTFLYTLDYEPPFHKLATTVALQMARDMGERLYVGEGYADLVDLDGIEHVAQDGKYIALTEDVLLLKDFAKVERYHRKSADQRNEAHHLLWEMADAKWQ